MWLPIFACRCGRSLTGDWLRCAGCGTQITQQDGIYRCLTSERRALVEPFLMQYRLVREQDGYRVSGEHYHRALPSVAPGDPQAPTWRIRQRSFERLCRDVLSHPDGETPAVLDLGAGNGWLSYQLTRRRCRAVAVDLLADDQDGLGACRHYDAPFACVQADFDALPFAPGQFDVVVFNGSLHYARDVAATLSQAVPMLAANGTLVVVDSPMFREEADGAAMRERLRERLRREYGVAEPIEPGEGFLTFSRLEAWASSGGRTSRFFPTNEGWRRRLLRLAPAHARGGSRPARFGVWVAA